MPRRMKKLELTMLARDADAVLEYLGKRGVFQLSSAPEAGESESATDAASRSPAAAEAQSPAVSSPVREDRDAAARSWSERLDRLMAAAAWLGLDLSAGPGPDTELPSVQDLGTFEALVAKVSEDRAAAEAIGAERRKVEDALAEASAFSRLKVPFSELDNLSYLTLRIGALDASARDGVAASLGDRAVIVPLGDSGRVLAASSRKGRFALDGELDKAGFVPSALPKDSVGIPSEAVEALRLRLTELEGTASAASLKKAALAEAIRESLASLAASFRMALEIERLKEGLRSSASAFVLAGWIPSSLVATTVSDLESLTGGRLAARAFEPWELQTVRSGSEKVPTSLKHGRVVGSFERLILSYGAPLYGTLDPTLLVAISFTLLFGIMFGDLGQGAVICASGIVLLKSRRLPASLAKFARFAPILISVGIASMIMGTLSGTVFADENLLVVPTRAITAALTGGPGVDRLLVLMPAKGSMDKLFAFFGFTLGLGAVLNSLGLVVNIVNRCMLRQWKTALFSKTGLAGALLFWYALYIAVRSVVSGPSFGVVDAVVLACAAVALAFGPAVWDLAVEKRSPFHDGAFAFFVEVLVELLESVSYYISNSVSYLRVGAFALSHAVLSFIVFELADLVAAPLGAAGGLAAFPVVLIGNTIIIVLEGMIVAIQVVRLQYYEFFSKFFTETGAEFAPFRFSREVHT